MTCREHVRVFALAILLLPATVFAQGATLSGSVRDSSGVVPGATVTLSVGDSDLAVATTDLRGVFRFERLTAGAYRVTVAHPGFEKITRDVTIGATNLPSVDFVLAVERFTTDLSVMTLGDRATASRLPVPNRALPAQVGSVSEETMRQQGTNSVADALKNVSGVQAVRWYGAYEQYSIRGFFDADRDQTNVVLVDGMRRAGNRYGTQTDNLESIEVLKGPASLLYGRGAVGGVINLIRKKTRGRPDLRRRVPSRTFQHPPSLDGGHWAGGHYGASAVPVGCRRREQPRLAARRRRPPPCVSNLDVGLSPTTPA